MGPRWKENTTYTTPTGNHYICDWCDDEVFEVEKVLAAKGQDGWRLETGEYEGERYRTARRENWPYTYAIYVRDGFDRFLRYLREDQRDEKGEKPVTVTLGNQEGPYFPPNSFKMMVEMAHTLSKIVPGIDDVKVWYDAFDDYTKIAFKVDGDSYQIRYYKVFAATKNDKTGWDEERTCDREKNFYIHSYKVENFFRMGKHRNWTV